MRVTCCKVLCCLPTFCVVHTVNRFDLWISKQYRRLAFKTMYVKFCNEAKSCAYWLVNETLCHETETFDFQSETRSRPRPSHVSTRPRRLETTSRDHLETETTSLLLLTENVLLLTTSKHVPHTTCHVVHLLKVVSNMHYQWIYNNFTYAHTFGKNIAKMVSATVQPRVKAFQLLALLMLLLLLLLLLLKHCQKRLQIWQVNIWQRYLTTWLEVSFRKRPTTLQQLLYVLPSVRPVIRHCCWFVAALKSKKCKTLEK